jgi:hypothetical protein
MMMTLGELRKLQRPEIRIVRVSDRIRTEQKSAHITSVVCSDLFIYATPQSEVLLN